MTEWNETVSAEEPKAPMPADADEQRNAIELFPEETPSKEAAASDEPAENQPVNEGQETAEPAEAEPDEASEDETPESEGKGEFFKTLLVFVIAFVLAILLNSFIFINSRVVSGSMENTVMTGDRVIGLRTAYWFSEPERGDIIVFNRDGFDGKPLLKRVIGLPGDTLEIRYGKLYINGELYEEDYLRDTMNSDYGPIKVPEGCYFVMGDNRNVSNDSRRWSDPFVEREDIVGKMYLRYWPLKDFGLIYSSAD